MCHPGGDGDPALNKGISAQAAHEPPGSPGLRSGTAAKYGNASNRTGRSGPEPSDLTSQAA
ncbi:hypothetical protein KRMM14A1004_24260 [Krasilnikovia sp. MM14-A1004]